jgi:hypothetical protein
MKNKYVSIKSVLLNFSLDIDDRSYNENTALNWAMAGYKKLRLEESLVPEVEVLEVKDHKAALPSNFKYLIQVVRWLGETSSSSLCNNLEAQDLPPTSSFKLFEAKRSQINWRVMRTTSNPFHQSVCLAQPLTYCTDCEPEFFIDETLTITTTFKDGVIMVAYLAYPKDEEGYLLIPDDEDLKDALNYYIQYRYWNKKNMMMGGDRNAERLRDHALQMWQTLSMKSKNLNLPDINQIENLKNMFNGLVPRSNRFQQMFMTLANRENVNF